MAYSKLPTRSSTDPNASADINQLQDNIKSIRDENIIINSNFIINQDQVNPVTGVSNNTYYIDEHESIIDSITGDSEILEINQPSELNGSKSYKHTATSTASGRIGYRHKVEEWEKFKDVPMNFSIYIKSNSSNARIIVADGVSIASSSSSHSGGGDWERLSLNFTPAATATQIHIYTVISSITLTNVSITSGDYVEGTGEMAINGSSMRDYFSRGIGEPEELSLCQRFYTKISGANLVFISGGYFNTTLFQAAYQYPVPMRSTPTITFSATSAITIIAFGGGGASTAIANSQKNNLHTVFEVTTAASTAGVGGIAAINSTNYIEIDSRL